MPKIVKIKRSSTTVPTSADLSAGELGYTEAGGKRRLFVGSIDGTAAIEIAGDGKMNTVPSAVAGDIAALNSAGQVIDSGVQVSTDGTFAANSNVLLPTQAATKTYVNSLIGNASSNINTVKLVTLASHGFAVSNVLALSSAGAYILANASSAATSNVVGIVYSVVDANSFVLLECGYATGLSGLTAGSTYYLSTTAGALTTAAPSNAISLLVADSAATGYFKINPLNTAATLGTTPLITAVITDPTISTASLAAGYYIFDVTPNAGLPSGITNLYDIVYYNGSAWSTFLTYANAGTQVRVGASEANVTVWQKFPNVGWALSNPYQSTSTSLSASHNLLVNFNIDNIFDTNGAAITADGTRVARWQNTGALINGHLAQTTVASRPIYSANAFGTGIGAVQFSAGDGTWMSSGVPMETNYGSFTMVLFVKFLSTNTTAASNNNNCFFFTGNDGTVEHNSISSLKSNANFQSIISSINGMVRCHALPVNIPVILTVRTNIDYGGTSLVHYIEIMLNGKPIASYRNTVQGSYLGIGSYMGLNAVYATGANTAPTASANLGFQIRDIRIYGGAKSDTDLDAIYNSMWASIGSAVPSTNYTPNSLIMWWDASNAGSITQSGGKVSGWNDIIGGATATQATTANQPAYVANAFGTMPGISFTAASSHALNGTNGIPHTVNITVFAVVQFPRVNGGIGSIFGTSANTNVFAQKTPAALYTYFGVDTTQNFPFVINTNYVLCCVIGLGNNGDQTAFSAGKIWTNASATGTTVATSTFSIGKNGQNSNYTDCILGELRIYQGTLSQSDISTIMQSLSTKWGITLF